MIWAIKMCFKIFGYVFIYSLAFTIALILLPFTVYTLCAGVNFLSHRKRKGKRFTMQPL